MNDHGELRERLTLADEIAVAVRHRIVSGTLEPGTKIRQQELAKDLGVSRTPLREAFRCLESEGWVDLTAHRGAEVRALTATEAEDIFAMRAVHETGAARNADATERAVADHILTALREITQRIAPDHEPSLALQLLADRYGTGSSV